MDSFTAFYGHWLGYIEKSYRGLRQSCLLCEPLTTQTCFLKMVCHLRWKCFPPGLGLMDWRGFSSVIMLALLTNFSDWKKLEPLIHPRYRISFWLFKLFLHKINMFSWLKQFVFKPYSKGNIKRKCPSTRGNHVLFLVCLLRKYPHASTWAHVFILFPWYLNEIIQHSLLYSLLS